MSEQALLHPNTKVKVAMILFVVSWAGLCLILGLLVHRRSQIENGEHRLLLVVAMSAVFILIRLVYAMLVFFLADSTFNFLPGRMTVMLVMSVLEKIGVVLVCLGVGLTLRVRETEGYSAVPVQSTVSSPYGSGQVKVYDYSQSVRIRLSTPFCFWIPFSVRGV